MSSQKIYTHSRQALQRGMTMIELMVVLAVIGLLASLLLPSFSGDSSKATTLLSNMTTMKDSVNRAKVELGGVPNRLSVLWNRTDATATNMFNGIAATTTWNGPYIERQPTDLSNLVTMTPIADAATVGISREAASVANGGNYTWVYFLRANNIPNPVIIEFMKKCTGTDVVTDSTFLNSRCRATLGSGSSEFGTVDLKVADSR